MSMQELTWFQQTRLQAVELLARWYGRLRTNDLIARFGISRTIAQRDIHHYLEVAPGNLVYDGKERAYLATSVFSPALSDASIDEYLMLEQQPGGILASGYIEQIKTPALRIRPEIVRIVLQALRMKQGLEIHYASLNHPNGQQRTIYPHTLVHSGFRWHLRAYCTLREDFRDFNLSRILDANRTNTMMPSLAEKKEDKSWNTPVPLVLGVNQDLSKDEQTLISEEYSLKSGQLQVSSNAALIPYVLQVYQVDPLYDGVGQALKNRLVLKNLETVKPYLWQQE